MSDYTLEPDGSTPPSELVQANIRMALGAAAAVVGPDAPTLQDNTSVTLWFNTTTGRVRAYVGLAEVVFNPSNATVAELPPADPTPGMQWYNTTNSTLYTWVVDAWLTDGIEWIP